MTVRVDQFHLLHKSRHHPKVNLQFQKVLTSREASHLNPEVNLPFQKVRESHLFLKVNQQM